MPDHELYLNKPAPSVRRIGFWKHVSEIQVQARPSFTHKMDVTNLRKTERWARSKQTHRPSVCLLCEQPLGERQFSCADFTWPEGYMHYLEAHNVDIDQPFAMFLAQQDSNVGRFRK